MTMALNRTAVTSETSEPGTGTATAGTLSIGFHYDFANSTPTVDPSVQSYAATIEQIVLSEQLGFDSAWVSEHHFAKDGRASSPLLLAAAIAARTSRLRIGTNLLILPLHHPVRLAEESATLALLSGGRFILGVGAGYMPRDFEVFRRSLSHRPSLMEEGIAVLRKAWAGDAFAFDGRRWRLPELELHPTARGLRVPIYVGGFAAVAIERAARIADGFLAGTPESIPVYLDAVERNGGDPRSSPIVTVQWAIIAEDPERSWAAVGPHTLAQLNAYVRDGGLGDTPYFRDEQDVLDRGAYTLWDGARAAAELSSLVEAYPQIVDIQFYGQLPGESIDDSLGRMEYIAGAVLPSLRAPR
jgi:alkanesulfonate monooxygenase SsuD/methylene tetrahydromethanopterin reductase-like flavin-dependent oxidoreductase (luciferase family)